MPEIIRTEEEAIADSPSAIGRRWKTTFMATFVIVATLAAMISSASVPPQAFADTESDNIIRVGVYEYPGYAYQDSDGVWRGISTEYMDTIGQQAGFQSEYVPVPNSSEMLGKLDSGDIDIAVGLMKTDERAQRYLYSEYEMGNASASVFVRSDDDRYDYGSINQIGNMRIGVEVGNSVTGMFEQWCASHDISPELTVYANRTALLSAVSDGEVDAGIAGEDRVEGFQTVMKFSTNPYYAMFRKDQTNLKNKVDAAMGAILTQDPLYDQELLEKYFPPEDSTMTGLSANEKSYVASHGTATVAVLRSDAPFSYRDKDGSIAGIIPDYFTRLGELTGLSFSFVAYDTFDDALGAVQDGEADILGLYSDDIPEANASGLTLTHAFATSSVMRIVRKGTQDIQNVAVPARSVSTFNRNSERMHQSFSVQSYPDVDSCYQALKQGSVDAVMCDTISATWLFNQHRSSDFDRTIYAGMNAEFSAATVPENSILRGILDKAIASSQSSADTFIAEDTLSNDSYTSLIDKLPVDAIVTIAIVFIAVALLLGFAVTVLLRRRRNERKLAAAQSEAAMAKAVNNERERFFSTVSHDMRTPLNGIMGFTELAIDADDKHQKNEYLEKIKASSSMLLALVNDVLTISRANAGKSKLVAEPTALLPFTRNLVIPIVENAQTARVNFELDTSEADDCVLMFDRLSLQKVLLNLLSNALKFTPENGHVRLSLTTVPIEGNACTLTAVVSDDGAGMSESYLPHAFDPFSQENAASEGGTGLGLSIVKQLVDQMGGSVDVQSELGRGTEFTVRLTLQVSDDEVAESAAGPALDHMGYIEGCHILLVEDNRMNTEIARTLLEKRGAVVDCAADGHAGVEVFAASETGYFDCILMDVRMPVMDGYAATRIIRQLERDDAPLIPIVAMTADAYADDVAKAKAAGMNGHIAKPVDPNNMFETIAASIALRAE